MSNRDDSTKVYVGNLDERTTKRDLERFFERAGTITDMWVARSPPGFAFVYFADRRDAEDACKDLDGREIMNRRVRVEVSTGPRRRDDRGGDRGGDRSGPPPRGRDDKCYVCGGHGHLARDCRDRRRSRSPRRSRSRSPPRRRSPVRDRSRSPRRDAPRESTRDRSPRRSRSPAPKDKDTSNGAAPERDREDAQPIAGEEQRD